MDSRKYYLNAVLMIIMVLMVLTAFAAPAFAEDAMTDSAITVTADQNGNEEVKDEFSDKFGPDRNRNTNDSRNESEDLNKSDSDKDNTPSWEEIMRLLEKMNGSSAQKNDENKPGIKTEKKPYIGVMVSSLSDEVKAITGLPAGVLVQQVKRNTPASKAGIQAYDIILKVNETDITSCEELASIIAESAPGDIVRIHLYRQGSILEFDVSPIS